MALGDPYIDLPTLKDYLKIRQNKIENDDGLQDALTSASREIERTCNRQFNLADTATARVFEPTTRAGYRVMVDDFATETGLVVEYDTSGLGDWVTLDNNTLEISPYNGIVDGQPGWPLYNIRVLNWYFPRPYVYRKRATFRVTAQWGWPSVPADVRQACLMLAADTYQQKDSPYGVMSEQYGVLMRPHGQQSGVTGVAFGKLARYVRHAVLVG